MITSNEIATLRLHAHQLAQPQFAQPAEIVGWLGAVQAQDYAGAKWSLAQRLHSATDATIEQAVSDGAILRTHLLRPTWHFVAAADIHWLLALSAPRVHQLNAYYYRKAGLDEAVFARSHLTIERALHGGKQLTRDELALHLKEAGIDTSAELRLAYLIMHAELTGLLCSGARRGKQFTYALLDERVPPTRSFTHDEALTELVKRYFQSHGPATLQDFTWWSSLTLADANTGLTLVGSALAQTVIDGKRYWHSPHIAVQPVANPTAWLLATYDEYLLSYADRSASLDAQATHMWNGMNQTFTASLVVDGQVVGVWRRRLKSKQVVIETRYLHTLTDQEETAVMEAIARYGQFLDLAVVRA